MNASRIIFTISFFGFSSSSSVKSGILKSLKAVKLCWMFVFVFGLMFCITMTGHAWVTLAHCAGIYYWRHRLGYIAVHIVGTFIVCGLYPQQCTHWVFIVISYIIVYTLYIIILYTQCTHWVFITRHRRLRLNIALVPTIIASSLFLLYMGKEGPMPRCVNKNTTKYFLKHNLCICFKIH